MGIRVQFFHPLTADYFRYRCQVFHTGKGACPVVLRYIEMRHIHPRQLCRCQQFFPACFLFHTQLFQKPQKFRQGFLPFADDHKISKFRQRFRIKSGTGTADDNKGVFFAPFFREQFNMPHLQLDQKVKIIHFKRNCGTDIRKICQRALGLHGKQSCFRFGILLPLLCLRQEYPFTGPAFPVQNLVQNMQTQVGHPQMVGVRV